MTTPLIERQIVVIVRCTLETGHGRYIPRKREHNTYAPYEQETNDLIRGQIEQALTLATPKGQVRLAAALFALNEKGILDRFGDVAVEPLPNNDRERAKQGMEEFIRAIEEQASSDSAQETP